MNPGTESSPSPAFAVILTSLGRVEYLLQTERFLDNITVSEHYGDRKMIGSITILIDWK